MTVHRPRSVRPRRAFTLIELLIVIGIIVVLVGLVVPSLARVRDSAREVVCRSNQRQIALAFLSFAADHEGRLPGNWWDGSNPDKEKRAWLLNSNEPFDNAPQGGTIYPYLGGNDAVYRCPSLQESKGLSAGSNGRFDYAAFIVFSGRGCGSWKRAVRDSNIRTARSMRRCLFLLSAKKSRREV